MLKCPECKTSIQIDLPADSHIKDMADLSRQNRANGGTAFVRCALCEYEGDPLDFDPRSLLPKVDKCYICSNGMVIALDAAGKHVPECQGFILEVASELKIRCDEKTQWHFGKTASWLQKANFGWWLKYV